MWAMHTPYKLLLHLDFAWLQHLELYISSKRTPQQKCLATGLQAIIHTCKNLNPQSNISHIYGDVKENQLLLTAFYTYLR